MDTFKQKELQEVRIKSWMRKDIDRLPDEENGFLNAGKKNEVISINLANANIAIKTGRQLFAKVPGIFIYDMDGSGNQLNIATRGLDPHRSWEFNIKQNGMIINSDMYGYPASYYSAPMESFEKIELTRSTGSLQYGAPFGGMVNYVTKRPDTTKPFAFESVNTTGSFGLLSSYNPVSGTNKKFSYSAYYYRRHSSGYRKNSESDAEAQYVQLQYTFSDRLMATPVAIK
jgi:Fe(3+) dicitrate transport protein